MKRLYRGPLLRADVKKATEHYERESATLSLNFLAAYGKAYWLLLQYPSMGSPRYAQTVGISGLRYLPMHSFPYLLFYREQSGHLVLSRLIHMSRDITSLLETPRAPLRKAVRRSRNPL